MIYLAGTDELALHERDADGNRMFSLCFALLCFGVKKSNKLVLILILILSFSSRYGVHLDTY